MPPGRPPKYETPEEMQKVIDEYFHALKLKQCILAGVDREMTEEELELVDSMDESVPTVSGLAYRLGMSRQALCDYEGKEQFLDTIKRAKQRIEISLENRLAGNNVTGAIFNLKNNFQWKDKTEQSIGGDPDNPITHSIKVSFTDGNRG